MNSSAKTNAASPSLGFATGKTTVMVRIALAVVIAAVVVVVDVVDVVVVVVAP